MIVKNYKQIGGIHPETATITNVLASQGFVAPHTGRPFSEAMVLGIAGGLGAGYILWEFKRYQSVIMVLGFQNRWNYTVDFMQNLFDRLGVAGAFKETGGQKTAAKHLHDALAGGRAAVAWVDQESLPYFSLRPMYEGCFGHFVTVFGLDEERDAVLIDDRSRQPLAVDAADFATARARIGSYKNRLLQIETGDGALDLEAAVEAGIDDCVTHLGRSSQTFALPVYQKWAKLMTDDRHQKGWPVVFKDGKGLYSTLRSLHEGIKLFGTAGGGLRTLYADFLDEAAPVLNRPALAAAAAAYRRAAGLWAQLADAALPEEVAPLAETRRLLAEKYALFNEKADTAHDELMALGRQLQELEEELNGRLPLTPEQMAALFGTMQGLLFGIYEAEQEALAALAAA